MSETPAVKTPPSPRELGARSDQTLALSKEVAEAIKGSYFGILAVRDLVNASKLELCFKYEMHELFRRNPHIEEPERPKGYQEFTYEQKIRQIARDYPPEVESTVIPIASKLNLREAIRILKEEIAAMSENGSDPLIRFNIKGFNEDVERIQRLQMLNEAKRNGKYYHLNSE